jgi:hypothetical protein
MALSFVKWQSILKYTMGENFPESERTKKARRKAGFYEKNVF